MNLKIHVNAIWPKLERVRQDMGSHLRYKLLIMKLIILLTLGLTFNVWASSYSQQVTLQLKKASIKTALQSIQRQTGYSFLVTSDQIEEAKPITIDVKNRDIKEVLPIVFKDQPLTFEIDNMLIRVITKKNPKTADNQEKILFHQQLIRGKVTNENGQPMVALTIKVKGSPLTYLTNENGEFIIDNLPGDNTTLVFSYIGYHTQEIQLTRQISTVNISLRPAMEQIEEVAISTGYQIIPKERATGSFEYINNNLINRRVSTNLIDRLEGIASGLMFPIKNLPAGSNESLFTIRGRSTIFANTQPLIILDNFPYDGDISNINPNDIEDITILKDAAAASIWGVRSGNGVIVIRTKKGSSDQPLKVEVNSNVSVATKPDVFYDKNFINSTEYIEHEQYLFNNGFYNSILNNVSSRPVVSPVVEILAQLRDGKISQEVADNSLSQLKANDVRNDFSKHFLRNSLNQQYAINIRGGGEKNSYYLSMGYDKNHSNLISNNYDRFALTSNNRYNLTRNIELAAILTYTQTSSQSNNNGSESITPQGKRAIYPYARLVDSEGKALDIPQNHRPAYLDTAGNGKLLDWTYRPLDEINIGDNSTKQHQVRINSSINYKLLPYLKIEAKYLFEKAITRNRNLQRQETYYTRNLINRYTQVNGNNVIRPIPLGGILDQGYDNLNSHSFRTQIDLNHDFNKNHAVSAIAGMEFREVIAESSNNRLYGYNDETISQIPVDYTTRFPNFHGLFSPSVIPNFITGDKLTDIFISYFANAAYNYKNLYTISASGRIDKSNLFGVRTNQKYVPLWSIGTSWNLSNENFYALEWLPYFKIRATYGKNGNLDKSVAAFVTQRYASVGNAEGLPYSTVSNTPNPELRWEKNTVLNLGIDFGLIGSRFTGSLEYYHRKGQDLIGNAPMAPSTGFTTFKGNVGSMEAKGVDFTLNSQYGKHNFKWDSGLLLSYNIDKITDYDLAIQNIALAESGNGILTSMLIPIEGRPLYSVYSFDWAGLDPNTGDPQGYINGEISKSYNTLALSDNHNEMNYNGPARPTFFGSFRNDFSYKNFTISINLAYKFGYFFFRNSINYDNLNNRWLGHADYSKRWQKPGDEHTTSVPSRVYPNSIYRDYFYSFSEILVQKGDHIRLQDIRLNYNLKHTNIFSGKLSNAQVYAYGNNLGIIWKANKSGIDPDFITGYPTPFSISLGFRANF